MRIQQDMRHRQTHHIGEENMRTRFSHKNFLLWLYALFATLKIGNILLSSNSVTLPFKTFFELRKLVNTTLVMSLYVHIYRKSYQKNGLKQK